MTRLMLNDEHWSKLRLIMRQHGVYDKLKLRLMVEGMLYRMRVGRPWRDLPEKFRCWNSIYQKFNRWATKDKLIKIFKSLVREPDCEWEFLDSSFIKAHQHSHGAPNKCNQAIGQSRGGNTTKIHMIVDSYGLPIEFSITGGDCHDVTAAPELINQAPLASYVVADRGYDSETLRNIIREKGSIPVIPRKKFAYWKW